MAYGLVYPIIVVCGRVGLEKIGKAMKKMMRITLNRAFSLPVGNLTETAREAWKPWG